MLHQHQTSRSSTTKESRYRTMRRTESVWDASWRSARLAPHPVDGFDELHCRRDRSNTAQRRHPNPLRPTMARVYDPQDPRPARNRMITTREEIINSCLCDLCGKWWKSFTTPLTCPACKSRCWNGGKKRGRPPSTVPKKGTKPRKKERPDFEASW